MSTPRCSRPRPRCRAQALHLLGLDAKREVQTLMKDLLESNGPYYPFMASDSYFKVWEGARLAETRPLGAAGPACSPGPSPGLSKHRAATSVAVELIQRIGQICKDARSKMDGPTGGWLRPADAKRPAALT